MLGRHLVGGKERAAEWTQVLVHDRRPCVQHLDSLVTGHDLYQQQATDRKSLFTRMTSVMACHVLLDNPPQGDGGAGAVGGEMATTTKEKRAIERACVSACVPACVPACVQAAMTLIVIRLDAAF